MVRRPFERRAAGWLRKRIMAVLAASPKPMQARAIQEAYADGGGFVHYSAVMRAIDELLSDGAIARVTLFRAYFSRTASSDGAILLICKRCGGVAAVNGGAAIGPLSAHARLYSFKPDRFVVEVSGLCARYGPQ